MLRIALKFLRTWRKVRIMNSRRYGTKYLKRPIAKLAQMAIEVSKLGLQSPAMRAQSGVAPLAQVLDEYVEVAPASQNALDIFKGEWSSQLPESRKELKAGTVTLFDDARITWAAEQLGGFRGQRVIELGPLEGGHTYMVESLGAETILAIEANKRAYLKCLIVKELLGLQRSHFALGDFVAFLRQNKTTFDVCLASGVLYHMQNPCELIHLIAKTSKKVVLWTHFYDENIVEAKDALASKFSGSIRENYNGFAHILHKYSYGDALRWAGFCGGSIAYSYWMSREDILACLRYFGFQDIKIGFEDMHHPNGPSFCIVAHRGD